MKIPRPTAHLKTLALDSARNFIADRAYYSIETLTAEVRERVQTHKSLAQIHLLEAKATLQAWKSYLAETNNNDPNTEDWPQ